MTSKANALKCSLLPLLKLPQSELVNVQLKLDGDWINSAPIIMRVRLMGSLLRMISAEQNLFKLTKSICICQGKKLFP